MTRLIADASVVVKWLVHDGETNVAEAPALLDAVRSRRVTLAQPPHWIAEVAAVLARLSSATAVEDVADLCAMGCERVQDPDVYGRAARLAIDLDHHLFDTLYHTVGLETPGSAFVPADDRYVQKAVHLGALVRLSDFL